MAEQSYEPERRRAADLRTGDRIIPGDLVGATEAHEVRHVELYTEDATGWPRVALLTRPDGRGDVFISYYHAGDSIALAAGVPVPEGVAGGPVGRASVHKAEGGDETTAWWTCMRCGRAVPGNIDQPSHAALSHTT